MSDEIGGDGDGPWLNYLAALFCVISGNTLGDSTLQCLCYSVICSSVSISEEGKGTCLHVCCFKVFSRHVPRNAKRRLLESVTREPMQIICKCVEPIINFHKQ